MTLSVPFNYPRVEVLPATKNPMSRLLGIVFIYGQSYWRGPALVYSCSWRRLVLEISFTTAFSFFRGVNSGDWGKRLFMRILGIGVLAFAVRLIVRIVHEAT